MAHLIQLDLILLPDPPTNQKESSTMTQRLIVVGPNLPASAKATFHVHAEGCADLKRGWLARAVDRDEVAAEYHSLIHVVEDVYQDQIAEQEPGFDPADWLTEFHFAPCVHLAERDEYEPEPDPSDPRNHPAWAEARRLYADNAWFMASVLPFTAVDIVAALDESEA